MSATSPRQKAERCFALARSTTFAGERDAAIARGISVAERAGLSLDEFEIPDRPRADRRGPAFAGCEQPSDIAQNSYSDADIRDVMARFREDMRAQDPAGQRFRWAVDEMMARAADAGFGFAAAFEAGRHDAAMARRPAREEQRSRWPDLKGCVDFLFSRGVIAYDVGDDADARWFVPGRNPDHVDDWGLRTIADELSA